MFDIINEQSFIYSTIATSLILIGIGSMKMVFTQSISYMFLILLAFTAMGIAVPNFVEIERIDIAAAKVRVKPMSGNTKYIANIPEEITLSSKAKAFVDAPFLVLIKSATKDGSIKRTELCKPKTSVNPEVCIVVEL